MIQLPPGIEAYVFDHATPEDPLLAELTAETRAKAKLPQMLTSHVEGSFLRLVVAVSGARSILEIGTYTGYSGLSMAMALPPDGKIITCDVDSVATAMAKRYWARSPHGSKIELRMGPALDTIQKLEGPFDFVFIDADKEHYVDYWESVLPKVRTGGLVAADNVLWSGKVLDPQSESDHAIVAFNDRVRNDDRVEAVMLTIRDGVTLARKK